MSCKKFLDKISLYIDGYLNSKEKEEVEKHINICESCKKIYEDIMTIKIITFSLKNKFPYEIKREKRNYLRLALTFALIILIILGIIFESKIFEIGKVKSIVKKPIKENIINKREIEPVKIYYTDTIYEVSYEEILP
ncbi:MAG: zf-HC2 domain-containing protein [candidate division WOR-3 bacterium]